MSLRMNESDVLRIVDAFGRPFETAAKPPVKRKSLSFGGGSANTYLASLAHTDLPPAFRAQDPFSAHAWVFAAAMTQAIVAGHAPFLVYHETDTAMKRREDAARKSGRPFVGARAGARRRALHRHMLQPLSKRIMQKAAEPDFEHPLMDVLLSPNPYQDGSQLFQLTHLWLAIRGEVFWVLTGDGGSPLTPGETPTQIWPLSPDLFTPVLSGGQAGDLVAWKGKIPKYMPVGLANKTPVFGMHEIVQFKYANPYDPLRGLSRLTAAAAAIKTDLSIRAQNMALINNDAVPRSAITTDETFSAEEMREHLTAWKEAYGGPQNAGQTAFLDGGFKFQTLGFSPTDMNYPGLQNADREEILAAMGTPPSVLGKTDAANWATALVWDVGFWEKTVLPLLRIEEAAIDRTLLAPLTDNTFGMFDLTSVEALRAGVRDKIDIADKMAQQNLHCPPRVAYQVVGLEVPEYEGDDLALAGFTSAPLRQVIGEPEGIAPGEAPSDNPAVDVPAADAVQDTALNGAQIASLLQIVAQVAAGLLPIESAIVLVQISFPTIDEETARALLQPAADLAASGKNEELPAVLEAAAKFLATAHQRKKKSAVWHRSGVLRKSTAARRWKAFVRLELELEAQMRKSYRRWVNLERTETLRRFDKATRNLKSRWTKVASLDFGPILPDLPESGRNLISFTKGVRLVTLEEIFAFTTEEFGIALIEIDDSRILDYMERRDDAFRVKAPRTIQSRLKKTLESGLKNDETIDQLRVRVGQAYDISASSSKTLTVARTETSNFMNGVRDQMFEAQGFAKLDWITANDEHVRDSHVTFGAAGTQARGFNYMTLVGGGGTLRHPGDIEGPAGEVINCRCMHGPPLED